MEPITLGAEIEDARERYFVGRAVEMQRLDALCGDEGPSIAYVRGPGGVGKSELLRVFARRWQRLGAAVAMVDAQSILAARARSRRCDRSGGASPRGAPDALDHRLAGLPEL